MQCEDQIFIFSNAFIENIDKIQQIADAVQKGI